MADLKNGTGKTAHAIKAFRKIAMKFSVKIIGMCFLIFPCYAFSNGDYYFDFSKKQPSDFLNFLRNSKEHGPYSIPKPISGWVKESDIPYLIKLIYSKENCQPVVLVYSSKLPLRSTIGDEATLLIMGFRKNSYPPELNSRPINDMEKSEIIKWWSGYEMTSK